MNGLNTGLAAAWIIQIRQVIYSPAEVSFLMSSSIGLKNGRDRRHPSSAAKPSEDFKLTWLQPPTALPPAPRDRAYTETHAPSWRVG